MSTDLTRCGWCGKPRRRFSEWEQQVLAGRNEGQWKRLCNRCATRRLNNPYSGILPMRRVAGGMS